MTDMKKVIYTCITGEYDDACAHVYVDDTWDYVMFTDNKYLLGMQKYMHWEIRPLGYNKLTNVKNARWHKINAHILFPEHDISLWVDGNIVIMKPDFFLRPTGYGGYHGPVPGHDRRLWQFLGPDRGPAELPELSGGAVPDHSQAL